MVKVTSKPDPSRHELFNGVLKVPFEPVMLFKVFQQIMITGASVFGVSGHIDDLCCFHQLWWQIFDWQVSSYHSRRRCIYRHFKRLQMKFQVDLKPFVVGLFL